MSSAIFGAVIACSVGALILWSNASRAVNRVIFTFSLHTAAWFLALHLTSAGEHRLLGIRLACAIGAFIPLHFWCVKEVIAADPPMPAQFGRRWMPWALIGVVLAAACFVPSFIPPTATATEHLGGPIYYGYIVVDLVQYAALIADTVATARIVAGRRRLEIQIWLGGGCVAAVGAVLLMAADALTDNAFFIRLQPILVIAVYAITVVSISSARVFDAQQLLRASLQQLLTVVFAAGLAGAVYATTQPRIGAVLALLATSAITLWSARAFGRWLDSRFQFYRSTGAAKNAVQAAGQRNLGPDKLEQEFQAILKGWGRSETALVASISRPLPPGQSGASELPKVASAMDSLTWATPERLVREPSSAERRAVACFLKQNDLGILVLARGRSSSTLVGVGTNPSRLPYTYPQVLQLIEFGEIIQSAIERANLTLKLQHAERLKAIAYVGASLAHEIRNPLNGILGIAGMLHESTTGERERRLTSSLRACADQLRWVIDDILDLALIDRGEVKLHLTDFSPVAAIEAVALSLDAERSRTRITTTDRAKRCLVHSDEAKFRQIVSNLTTNALKHGIPAEADIQVDLSGGRLSVAVINTGPDISAADRARIFNWFERGRSAARPLAPGLGIGLTLASHLATAMGGGIDLESSSGVTRFTLSIPATGEPLDRKASSTASTSLDLRGRVLAIEDELYNRLVLGHILGGLGFEVEWAQNGTEALDILKSGRSYANIFTDWMLPDIQGDELVRRIKGLRGDATPPIIAVTAYATEEKRAEAFAVGVTAFVTKPITPEKIQQALRRDRGHEQPAKPTALASDEPLRLGILLDGDDAAERVTSFRNELTQYMSELETALRQHDSERTVRTAHRLASQLLAIHHHTFADELRALETAALRYQWDLARDLHANATRAATSLCRQLDEIVRRHLAEPTPDRT